MTEGTCICEECERPIHADLLVPDDVWAQISPRPVEGFKGGGVLCPSCIMERISERGIWSAGRAMDAAPDNARATDIVERLEWFDGTSVSASCCLGQYWYNGLVMMTNGSRWLSSGDGGEFHWGVWEIYRGDDIEAAKSAAQADYEQRILAALSDREPITRLRSELESARERADNMQAELESAGLFLMALRIAHAAHDGQTDKTGAAYILHPLRVSMMGECAEDRIVGMLHDVVEDCPEWPLKRLAQYFPPHIIEAVEALTKRDGEDYEAFIERVKLNEIAARVKMNDIADNMDPFRLNKLPPDVGARLQRKYSRAIRALQHSGEKP